MNQQISADPSRQHQIVNESFFDVIDMPCYLFKSQTQLGSPRRQMFEEPELIFIPQEARGQPVEEHVLSARLTNLLRREGIQLFGQLHGLTFASFAARPNCSDKTLQELRALVRTVQRGQRKRFSPLLRTLEKRALAAFWSRPMRTG
jgi:hypothetical protein